MEAVNVSVLLGPISAPPEVRALKSGRRVATLAVRTIAGDGRNTSVPVTVWDPPAWLETLESDDDVLVVDVPAAPAGATLGVLRPGGEGTWERIPLGEDG